VNSKLDLNMNIEELYHKLYSLKMEYKREWDNGFSRNAFFVFKKINQVETELGLELTRL
jgi:hypothetical protein